MKKDQFNKFCQKKKEEILQSEEDCHVWLRWVSHWLYATLLNPMVPCLTAYISPGFYSCHCLTPCPWKLNSRPALLQFPAHPPPVTPQWLSPGSKLMIINPLKLNQGFVFVPPTHCPSAVSVNCGLNNQTLDSPFLAQLFLCRFLGIGVCQGCK